MTSDMPWASAWYADHASLWLPDSIADFDNLHDNTCPTGLLFFTPVTTMQPVVSLISGEEKDWFPFITGVNLPNDFPPPWRICRSQAPIIVSGATQAPMAGTVTGS